MTTEQVWLVAVGAVALVALLVAVLSWWSARRARASAAEVVSRLSRLESAAAAPAAASVAETVVAPSPYVITGLDGAPPSAADPVASAQRIDGRLFTDIVARESVVRAASWSQGVRRALSPESRNRIRFQVRQQAKQARQDRRTEVREALREYRARQRADEGDAA